MSDIVSSKSSSDVIKKVIEKPEDAFKVSNGPEIQSSSPTRAGSTDLVVIPNAGLNLLTNGYANDVVNGDTEMKAEDGTNFQQPIEEDPKLIEEKFQKKFMAEIEDYPPTIPDATTKRYLDISGFATCDDRTIRLISLTTQKFISDVMSDAFQRCKSRSAPSKSTKEKRYTLTLEDLIPAIAEYGIELKKPSYFN